MPVKIGLQYIEKWKESLENAVRKYEQEPVIKGQIVFYGPSNFTRWERTRWGHTPLREAVVGASGAPCVINRGFGSSCPEHQLYYYPRMIRPLEPKVLVYSCGVGNARGFGYTPEESWELAQRVVAYAMADFPDIHVYLCGARCPAYLNEEQLAQDKQFNEWLKEFAQNTPNCFFIDEAAYEPLRHGDIFAEDGKHFNQKGYDIYADLFREALKDELEQF